MSSAVCEVDRKIVGSKGKERVDEEGDGEEASNKRTRLVQSPTTDLPQLVDHDSPDAANASRTQVDSNQVASALKQVVEACNISEADAKHALGEVLKYMPLTEAVSALKKFDARLTTIQEWWSAPDEEKAQHEENYKQRKKKEEADEKAAQELDNQHKQEDLDLQRSKEQTRMRETAQKVGIVGDFNERTTRGSLEQANRAPPRRDADAMRRGMVGSRAGGAGGIGTHGPGTQALALTVNTSIVHTQHLERPVMCGGKIGMVCGALKKTDGTRMHTRTRERACTHTHTHTHTLNTHTHTTHTHINTHTNRQTQQRLDHIAC